jgi:hypothetical protein
MNVKLFEDLPFDIGQKVFYISARTKTNNYRQSTVRSYNAEIGKIEGQLVIFSRNVHLMALNIMQGGDGSYPVSDVFATEEEVREATKFYPVTFITSDEWEQAIGTRREDGVSIEDCELQPCCGTISDIRELLYQCYMRNGLIKLDRDRVASLITSHYDYYENIPPLLTNIFQQLKVDMPATEAEDEV